jgi:aminotransferase in exopolysaccharide biosynthesis
MNKSLINFIHNLYETDEFIPLHEPQFEGNEKKYVTDAIDSTYVSSSGYYVNKFEEDISVLTSCTKAVSLVNGTAALSLAMYMSNVRTGDLVITQPLTFIATCNAIHHLGASPIFIDISLDSLGLDPAAVLEFLEAHACIDDDGNCVFKESGQKIKAIVPMHTFGHPVDLDQFTKICEDWNLILIEDAAESLGSLYKGKHTGTFGRFGALSFNGNKTITTGGGGMLLCSKSFEGERAKNLSTTAKLPHPYEFFHDEAGFNMRMPNLNAALGCAQLESLEKFLIAKKIIANSYREFFADTEATFISQPEYAESNYWLNAILCADETSKNELLEYSNNQGVNMRPIWKLMYKLPMFSHAIMGEMGNAEKIESLLVNLPSSPRKVIRK